MEDENLAYLHSASLLHSPSKIISQVFVKSAFGLYIIKQFSADLGSIL